MISRIKHSTLFEIPVNDVNQVLKAYKMLSFYFSTTLRYSACIILIISKCYIVKETTTSWNKQMKIHSYFLQFHNLVQLYIFDEIYNDKVKKDSLVKNTSENKNNTPSIPKDVFGVSSWIHLTFTVVYDYVKSVVR